VASCLNGRCWFSYLLFPHFDVLTVKPTSTTKKFPEKKSPIKILQLMARYMTRPFSMTFLFAVVLGKDVITFID